MARRVIPSPREDARLRVEDLRHADGGLPGPKRVSRVQRLPADHEDPSIEQCHAWGIA